MPFSPVGDLGWSPQCRVRAQAEEVFSSVVEHEEYWQRAKCMEELFPANIHDYTIFGHNLLVMSQVMCSPECAIVMTGKRFILPVC